jgi:hypothetical protein
LKEIIKEVMDIVDAVMKRDEESEAIKKPEKKRKKKKRKRDDLDSDESVFEENEDGGNDESDGEYASAVGTKGKKSHQGTIALSYFYQHKKNVPNLNEFTHQKKLPATSVSVERLSIPSASQIINVLSYEFMNAFTNKYLRLTFFNSI